MTTNLCECDVCAALGSLRPLPQEAAEEVVRRLPLHVQRILAAQGRVLQHRPLPGDAEIVRQAAKRCSAGSWTLPVIH